MFQQEKPKEEYEVFMFLRPLAGAIGSSDGNLSDYLDLATERKIRELYPLRTFKVLTLGYWRARSQEAKRIRSRMFDEISMALEEDDSEIFSPSNGNSEGIIVRGETPQTRALKRTHIKNKLDLILGVHISFDNK